MVPLTLQIQAVTIPVLWNEKLFPDPHTLKPQRHLDENGQFVKNDNLIPFGVGQ